MFMPRPIDLTGQKFGRLTVIERAGSNKFGTRLWLCKCDCGNDYIGIASDLKNGHVFSCGCFQREGASERFYKHGIKRSDPLYGAWSMMKDRCYNPHNEKYPRYGARGIYVCDEWRNDIKAYRDWAIEHGWTKGMTIDRIDNDGPYCPENCRVADAYTQMNNTSRNIYIEYNGETRTVTQWARSVGLKPKVLYDRLRHGWSLDKAMNTPYPAVPVRGSAALRK